MSGYETSLGFVFLKHLEASTEMDLLIRQIKQHHFWTPPLTETEELIQQFETSNGFRIAPDLRRFYQQCGAANLFDETYNIVPLTDLHKVSAVIFGDEAENWCPDSWYGFCDMRDGDYVGIDFRPKGAGSYDILDCNHEDLLPCQVIATSFSRFLARALDSGGERFWMAPHFENYGFVDYEVPPDYYRTMDASFWQSLGPEDGPELCTTPQCTRRRIQSSTQCRRHHFEMVCRRPCPFDD